ASVVHPKDVSHGNAMKRLKVRWSHPYNAGAMPKTRARPPIFRFLVLLVAVAAAAASAPAAAQMTVEITGVGSQQYPIAVASFKTEGSAPHDIAGSIRADLTRSGQFRMVDPGDTPLAESERVDHAVWRGRGADTLVVGSVSALADGRFDIRFRLYDNVKNG